MNPEVSVIVPVYNVEEYLDVCMESLCGQSFKDMEILLINDGSADGSARKCLEWAERDSRIRYVSKENEGVAKTRNLGVSLARGKYLAFVDPDDWMDPDYIKKLYKALEDTGADFAECDLWRYDNRTGKKTLRSSYGRMGVEYTLTEHMKYAPTATYKSMSRRALWMENSIKMPSCSFESPAVYALILALSRKIVNIREPLYYYRTFRENSLIENGYAKKDGSPDNTLGIEAMDYLMSEFRRCGVYGKYEKALEGIVKYRLSDILATQFHRKSKEDYRCLSANCRRFLDRAFPEGHNEAYITWGGFNLNRIMVHMNWLHDPGCRFNFSSIISVCGEKNSFIAPEKEEFSAQKNDFCRCLPESAAEPFTHKNRYRQQMLERERTCEIWHYIAEYKPAYLMMDLIEERFDLICAGGRYLTKSDAYDGKISGGPEGSEILERSSEECTELLKKCAVEFFERIKRMSPGIQVVLIENYLSETYGNPEKQHSYEDQELIRRQNRTLEKYYAFVEEICPDAVVIRPSSDELYFTDENFGYGRYPWHLNEIVNQRIAERIEESLNNER